MDYGEFFSQGIVQALMLVILLPLFLLAVYIASVYVRWARRKKNETLAPETVTPTNNAPSGLELLKQASFSPDDLPDLELLVSAPRVVDGTIKLASGQSVRAELALSVLRDERDGRLLVKIGEKGYRSLADAPDAKREFTRIMKELSSIIMQADDNPPTEDAPAPKPAPVPQPAPVASAPEMASDDVPLPSVGDLLRPEDRPHPITPAKDAPRVPKGDAVPGDLPSYRFDDNPASIVHGRMGVKKVEFVPPPDLDIPSAIEQFLQYKLRQTGMFPAREIHVLPALGGGVRIRVDNDYYEFVDEVRDVEVRAFIQASIAEWQERQG